VIHAEELAGGLLALTMPQNNIITPDSVLGGISSLLMIITAESAGRI
jgi:hypothetical protein